MTVDPSGTARTSFDFKSAFLSVVAIVLKTADTGLLANALASKLADDPEFFDNDALLVDISTLREEDAEIDFPTIVTLLRKYRTLPVAVRGGSEQQMSAALAAGLAAAPEELPVRAAPPTPAPALQTPAQEAAQQVEVVREVQVPGPGTLVIDKPLRSGQQVYARGGDLVVMAVVSFGAEVIADGNIHVYAPLRGRAIAGARGNTEARIFSTCLEPQLVSIAGIYRTTETELPANVAGKPAQVRLDGEKLLIEPLAQN